MKISALTAATTPLSGAELFPIVQSGNTRRVSLNDLLRSIGNGTVSAPSLAAGADPNTGLFFPAADTVALVTGGVERWRTDANGRVGIGVTSLSAQFQVGSGGAFGVQSQRDGNGNTFTPQMAHVVQSGVAAVSVQVLDGTTNKRVGLFMDATNNIAGINANYSSGAPNFAYSVGTTEIFRATPDGAFGVGTNNPFFLGVGQTSLTVSGSASARLMLEDVGSTGDVVGSLLYNDGAFSFITANRSGSNTTGSSTRLFLNSRGDIGLAGLTPPTMNGVNGIYTQYFSLVGRLGTYLSTNAYFDNAWKYDTTGVAAEYEIVSGEHRWRSAPSGTAGATITFVDHMRLNASGNLGIGTTTPDSRLQVGAAGAHGTVRFVSQGIDIQGAPVGGWVSGFRFRGGAGTLGGGLFANGTADDTNFYTVGSASGTGLIVRHDTATVGIATTSPKTRLDVAGNVSIGVQTSIASATSFSGTRLLLVGGDANGCALQFYPNQTLNGDSARIVGRPNNYGVDSTGLLEFFTNNGAGSGSVRWLMNPNGHLLAGADNTYDIGASAATRPRDLHLARNLVGAGWVRAGAASAGAASTTTIGGTTATTVGAAGAASALPANPLGYIVAHVGTTEVRIPYYNA